MLKFPSGGPTENIGPEFTILLITKKIGAFQIHWVINIITLTFLYVLSFKTEMFF